MPSTLVAFAFILLMALPGHEAVSEAPIAAAQEPELSVHRQINFVVKNRRRTPNPPGWEAYDGAVYTPERGYGWLTDMVGKGWDGGGAGVMLLPDGSTASPIALGRLELANWQGTHQENLPLVFRLDLPNGWYRITCTSVDPDNAPLPLVDQRSIKFRAHDVVLAGPPYGPPLQIEGNRLLEGSGVVEVFDGHLRIIVGDPAYGGWTWSYTGPWFRGWREWLGKWGTQRYATGWFQKLRRIVDPGFHSLRVNSLVVERVAPPATKTSVLFADFFHRDDRADMNVGVAAAEQWHRVALEPAAPHPLAVDLYKTALRVTAARRGRGVLGIMQGRPSPTAGTIRYSTRVSLFTGAGSKLHSGYQEAGIVILGDPEDPRDVNSTFIGVTFEVDHPETLGGMVFRVGNGADAFRDDLRLPDTRLPFKVEEGEYEIVVEHQVEQHTLTRIQINGADVTHLIPLTSRTQRRSSGLFGVQSTMDRRRSGVPLQQFYWYFRVEAVA